MNPITTSNPDPGRAAIARELARYYAELSGFDDAPPQQFSVARAIREAAKGGLAAGYEYQVCSHADLLMGRMYSPTRLTIPLQALARDMSKGGGGGRGGYLVGLETPSPIDVLKPYSVVAQAGVTVLENMREDVAFPRVVAAGSGGWLAEGAALPEAQPTMGSASATPKIGGAIIKLSHAFMQQAEAAEEFIRSHLLRAAGDLLDRAFFSGAGQAAPLGLYNTVGANTQSGTNLARAGLLAMREAVLNAGAREANLTWVGSPDVQELLSARVGVANTPSYLWADDGTILGRPAHATPTAVHVEAATNYPALTVGDFSAAQLVVWGPASLQVSVDRYNAFESGGIAVRVLLLADFVFPQPTAFATTVKVT